MKWGQPDDDEISGRIYDRRLVRRLLAYARPYRCWLALSIGLIIFSAGLELLWPQFVRIAIDRYVEPPGLALDERFHGVLLMAGFYLLTLLGSVGLEYLQTIVTSKTGQNVLHDLRMDLFFKVENLSVNFFTRNPVGRLVTRTTNDINQLNELFTTGIVGIYGDLIMLVGILVLMFWMHPRLALVSLLVLPLIVAAAMLFRWYVRPAYLQIRRHLARMNAYLQEHLSGVSVVQMFNRQDRCGSQFDLINRDHLASMKLMIHYHGIFNPTVDALSNLAISVLLYGGAVFITGGSLKIGTLVAFLLYCRRFYRPVMDLSQKYNILQDAMTSSARIFSLMDETDITAEPAATASVPDPTVGLVEFRDVWFGYVPGEWVLQGVSFTLRPCEKIALVGLTGAGKTTILNLLLRFYECQRGEILLDGVPIQAYTTRQLRSAFAVVDQDVFLFAGTILDNICLWSSTLTEESAIEAARMVYLDEFVKKFSRGYSEPVVEGGKNLSAGQKQLISFARALAGRPKILLLDEATSSIDSLTEHLIQNAVRLLLAKQTSLIVAHRLSTIRTVDRILVIHRGRLVEEGNHEGLLCRNGVYAKLHALQFEEPAADLSGAMPRQREMVP